MKKYKDENDDEILNAFENENDFDHSPNRFIEGSGLNV
jgi:hypothetical protein